MNRFLNVIKVLGFTLSLFTAANVWADAPVSTPTQLYYPNINTVMGNPNGKVTIVEFFDYNCEYCHEVPKIFNSIVKKNSNVRIVFRDYPVLGPGSIIAARAAVAAGEQGKYLALHNALFASHQPLTDSVITRLAASVGIDTQKLHQDASGRPVNLQLKSSARAASELGLNGVPVVLVAPTPSKDQKAVRAYVLTAPSYGELQAAIKDVSVG